MSVPDPGTKASRIWQCRDRLLPTPLLVALLSATVYLAAYAYELGYLKSLGVPTTLARVELTQLLSVASVIVLGLSLALIPLGFLVRFFLERESWVFATFGFPALLGLWVIIEAILFGSMWQEWVYLAGWVLLISLIWIGHPIVTKRRVGNIVERLREVAKEEDRQPSTPRLIARYVGHGRFLLICLLVMVVFFAHEFGRAAALRGREFPVLQGSNELLVRAYDAYIITAIYDRSSHALTGELVVREGSAFPELRIEFEEIGPLKPVASSKQQPELASQGTEE